MPQGWALKDLVLRRVQQGCLPRQFPFFDISHFLYIPFPFTAIYLQQANLLKNTSVTARLFIARLLLLALGLLPDQFILIPLGE
ncbi:hypothetical protein BTA51_02015 [Hahella sp. CCB-MM4]|uniref:hypothetical protein n=1 Tax=Hahella sp. (strain CCB-MM4) TaxID=1926491 RepID=UPI000B9A7425|nr:hypothetical protein [Hahella sp. CCB-MM4]OZG75184.1 hypothetical protein BTA51_02015 [Hahella sp. CCB-MM4]